MENIFTVAKPFLIFAKLLGVFPMSFDGPARKGFLKTKLADLVHSIFSFVIIFSLFYYVSFASSLIKSLTATEIAFQGWMTALYLQTSIFICLFLYQLSRCRNVVRFLNLVHCVDKKVKMLTWKLRFLYFSLIFQTSTMNIRTNHKKQKILVFSAIFIGLAFICLIVSSFQVMSAEDQTVLSWLSKAVVSFTATHMLFYLNQFILVSAVISSRFNELLTYIDNLMNFKGVANVHEQMKRAESIFDKLCDGIEIINKSFTWPFVLLFPLLLVS
jgi:hypothetical protein